MTTQLFPSQLATAIEATQIAFQADFGRSPQIELQQTPQVTWYLSGYPYARFNRVLQACFENANAEAGIQAALAPFQAAGVPLLWHTGPSTRPLDLGERLLDHGFEYRGDESGMALELASFSGKAMPPGLTVEPVNSLEGLQAWCGVFARAYAEAPDSARVYASLEADLLAGRPAEDSPRRLYLGLLDGKPAACSALFRGQQAVGLFCIGALPEKRRQGLGTALTVAPLREAQRLGYGYAVLNASPLGEGIYRRLGFEKYCVLGRYQYSPTAPR